MPFTVTVTVMKTEDAPAAVQWRRQKKPAPAGNLFKGNGYRGSIHPLAGRCRDILRGLSVGHTERRNGECYQEEECLRDHLMVILKVDIMIT
ncbi:hypothetical protein KBTX_03697 [wastewater metagenome]|uniref:Uncharacterized protein n=2 Tax=unclassified sequences TaxID=12908 RepID=A0A5B8RHG5_9ZZZZ|nr:hypothetical protein KBTEX_03697 [uncultured organism]